MRLYHASYLPIERPEVFHSRPYLDFGKGFYLTSLKDQAEKYAAKLYFQADTSARIIEALSELFGLPLQEATDYYYTSETSNMIEDGISDLHCRSDKYLATLIWEERVKNSLPTPMGESERALNPFA